MEQSTFGFDVKFDENPKKKKKTPKVKSKKKNSDKRIVDEVKIPSSEIAIDPKTTQKLQTEPHIFTVSEINDSVKSILEKNYSDIWVVGEVSGFKPSSTGHYYFQLKDEKAVLRSIIWKGIKNKILTFKMDGIRGKNK